MSPSGLESCEEFRRWLGWDLLARAFTVAAAPCVAMSHESSSSCPWTSHHLISVTCPNHTSLSSPLGGAQIILASPTTNKHLTDMFVSAPGKTTLALALITESYKWPDMDPCHLELISQTGQLRCRMCWCRLQKFVLKICWFGFLLFV